MELKGKRVAFLGDSITFGKGASAPEKMFANMLAARNGMTVVGNHSICGTRIARQTVTYKNPVWDQDFCARVEEMDPTLDLIVIFGGTNDFGHGDAPFGDFADRTAETFCGAIHELYTSLLEKYPTATIMIITPLHRSTEDVPNMHGKVLKDYVDMIRRTAEYYSLPVLDLYATYGVQPAVPVMQETFMPDGLHPNDAGQIILANKVAKFIQNL